MSAEATREFVDANILVYAFDPSAGAKWKPAPFSGRYSWFRGVLRYCAAQP